MPPARALVHQVAAADLVTLAVSWLVRHGLGSLVFGQRVLVSSVRESVQGLALGAVSWRSQSSRCRKAGWSGAGTCWATNCSSGRGSPAGPGSGGGPAPGGARRACRPRGRPRGPAASGWPSGFGGSPLIWRTSGILCPRGVTEARGGLEGVEGVVPLVASGMDDALVDVGAGRVGIERGSAVS